MTQKIALFWPGDERPKPNELAQPNVEEAKERTRRVLATASVGVLFEYAMDSCSAAVGSCDGSGTIGRS